MPYHEKLSNILPVPCVYGIRCKVNNKHYIGETIQIKARIRVHRINIKKNDVLNRKFLTDFRKYGASNFEFTIYNSGGHLTNFINRKKLETALQTAFRQKGLCYNDGLQERMEARRN